MADLDVQPKRSRAWWPWLLLLLLALAALFFLARGCESDPTADAGPPAAGIVDSTAAATSDTVLAASDWDIVNFDAPAIRYEEITDRDINVRGDEGYAIYGIDETILFDSGKADLKAGAEEKLRLIAASMGKRFKAGPVRIYGFTDAKGSAGYNQQLAEQRAEAVRNWLVQNGNIAQQQASVHPVGEARPVASNATAAGRSQNRRVEIVARQGAEQE